MSSRIPEDTVSTVVGKIVKYREFGPHTSMPLDMDAAEARVSLLHRLRYELNKTFDRGRLIGKRILLTDSSRFTSVRHELTPPEGYGY